MKALKTILNILKWIIIAILVFLVIIIGSIFIQTKVNPDKVPNIFGYKPFIVLSGSMETEIYKGDLVIVKNVDAKTLEKENIIAFRDEEGYVVTHRIVSVINNEDGTIEFITKGDNNNIEDEGSVKLDKVEGLYVKKISKFGNVLLTLQKPLTLGIVLGLIVVCGAMWIMAGNNKMSKEEKAELERLRKEKSSK